MPSCALTDSLIPRVYEALGLASTNNTRVEPDGGNTRVTRILNEAYVEWAITTQCFRRRKTVTLDAMPALGLVTVPTNMFRVADVWYEDDTTPLATFMLSEAERKVSSWRTAALGDPTTFWQYQHTTLALYPPPMLLKGAWATATAYSARHLVTNGTPSVTYRCTAAHTAAAATEPGVGADWETVWTTTMCQVTVEGFVVPTSTEEPYVLSAGEGGVCEPDFPERYWPALSYGAALILGQTLIADDPGLAPRLQYADLRYTQLRDQFMWSYLGGLT
jgi:hypothetical protein